MKTIPYLTQYCNMCFEWQTRHTTPDNANESQLNEIKELQCKTIGQSGLTINELVLVCMCRKYGIFEKVNQYAHMIKRRKTL